MFFNLALTFYLQAIMKDSVLKSTSSRALPLMKPTALARTGKSLM